MKLTGLESGTLIVVSGLKLCQYLVSQMPVLKANFKIHVTFWIDKMTWIWHLKVYIWGGGGGVTVHWLNWQKLYSKGCCDYASIHKDLSTKIRFKSVSIQIANWKILRSYSDSTPAYIKLESGLLLIKFQFKNKMDLSSLHKA